jgi:hypothetical protein
MTATLDSARSDWADGHRRYLVGSADRSRTAALEAQLEVLLDELRRRIGQTFTLAELAELYVGSDHWARESVSERVELQAWPVVHAIAVDEAFFRYSRGALDYAP